MPARPNIFEYTNYRDFLKDFYHHAKGANANFSYRYFAKKAGFASSNFLLLIITGKRNLTEDYIPSFSKAIGLGKRERRYFEALVAFNQAKKSEAKRYYFELLQGLRQGRVGTILKDEQFEYISNWHFAVIRELVLLPTFREDPQWIRRQLRNKITFRQAAEAVEKLLRWGFLRRGDEGRLRQADGHLTTEDEVVHTAAYAFHQQMLSLAKEVLATTDSRSREVSGITMAVSKGQFREIKRMIQEFEDSVLRYLSTGAEGPESVFQLNVQLFSITNHLNGRQDA